MITPRVQVFESKHVKGEKFGTKGSINYEEWEVIQSVLDEYEIKTVLEFGSGFSTKKFCEAGVFEVVSLETNKVWAEKVGNKCSKARIFTWNNTDFPSSLRFRKFDLAFVDGESPRDEQLRHGMNHADRLFIHDAGRQEELGLIKEQLNDWKRIDEFSTERLAFFERT